MKPSVLLKFKQLGKRYLVSQAYERGRDEVLAEGKDPILLSHYDDKGLAQIHYNALPEWDKYRFILDLQNEAHERKVFQMLSPDSKYILYANLLRSQQKDMDKMMKEMYFENVSRFIVARTHWHLGKNKFDTRLEAIFGELYLEIRLNNEKVRVKFEEIENS